MGLLCASDSKLKLPWGRTVARGVLASSRGGGWNEVSRVDFTNTVGKCQGAGGAKREALSQAWEPVASRRTWCLSDARRSYWWRCRGWEWQGRERFQLQGMPWEKTLHHKVARGVTGTLCHLEFLKCKFLVRKRWELKWRDRQGSMVKWAVYVRMGNLNSFCRSRGTMMGLEYRSDLV